MNEKTQIACVVCGAAFVALFTLGWIIVAGLVPAPSPAFDVATIAEFYAANTGTIRFGLLLAMISGSLTIPWLKGTLPGYPFNGSCIGIGDAGTR